MNDSRQQDEGGRGSGEALPFRIVIAGGGIAALEAILALRELLGRGPRIDLVAPSGELAFRPLAVGEPFGMGEVRSIALDRVAAEHAVVLHRDLLDRVDSERGAVITADGAELSYDALLVAIGARAEPALPGALTYGGPESNEAVRALLESLRAGDLRRVVFAVPPGARWPMPLYELAVLTARYARTHAVPVELLLATHETAPLELFGPRASEGVQQLLAIEGVDVHTSAAPTAVKGGELRLANGGSVEADAVVALPRFRAAPIPGLPQGPGGFLSTDVHMRVDGVDRVWAAGDVTWFPIKQGGLAAQQADAAASAIAHRADPTVAVQPFVPVLRGAMMTGSAPRYLLARLGAPGGASPETSAPLWSPPSKVAGRLLAPYLATRSGSAYPRETFTDLEPADGSRPEQREEAHREALELALSAAELDADGDDFAGALRWLEVAEHLNLTLPPEYAGKRERWSEQRDLQAVG